MVGTNPCSIPGRLESPETRVLSTVCEFTNGLDDRIVAMNVVVTCAGNGAIREQRVGFRIAVDEVLRRVVDDMFGVRRGKRVDLTEMRGSVPSGMADERGDLRLRLRLGGKRVRVALGKLLREEMPVVEPSGRFGLCGCLASHDQRGGQKVRLN